MNNTGILSSAVRTLLVAALGFVVSKGYITSDLLNAGAGLVGFGLIAWWSLATKAATATQLVAQVSGVARNFLVAALTFATGKGWVGSDQVAAITAAVGTLAAFWWSAEAKYVTSKLGALLAFLLLPAILFAGFVLAVAPASA